MSVARKIIENTIAQILSKFIVALIGIATIKIITNYLSVEGFGQYTLIYEFLAFFGIAADLGLFTIAVREISEDESKMEKIIGNVLSLRTILAASTIIIGTSIAFLIPKYQGTTIPLGIAIASFTVFFSILSGTITSILQVRLQMGKASLTVVFGRLITLALMIYIIFFGFSGDTDFGFYMLLLAGVVGNIAMYISTHYFVRKITPIHYRFDFDIWKDMLKKSLPYGLALILSTIYFRIDTILISLIRNDTEVGIYGVGMKMLEYFAIVPLYFMNSVLPILTKAIKEKTDKYKTIIRYAFDFLSAMSVPMVVGVVVLAYPITFVVSSPEFLSREGFAGSDIALSILIFALLFQFLNILFTFILIALGKQTKILYINLACVIFNITANLIVIPIYGFRGAAVITVLSELFILIVGFITARHYLSFTLNFSKNLRIILSAAVMGVAIYFLQPLTYKFMQNWNLLVLVPIGMIIYAAMLFLTKTVDKDMLAMLKKPDSGAPGNI